jgi:hypothetical protein
MKPQLEQFLSLVKENQIALEEFKKALEQRNKIVERLELIQSKLNDTLNQTSSHDNVMKDMEKSTQQIIKTTTQNQSNDDSLIERIKKINQRNHELIQQNEIVLSKKITIK